MRYDMYPFRFRYVGIAYGMLSVLVCVLAFFGAEEQKKRWGGYWEATQHARERQPRSRAQADRPIS